MSTENPKQPSQTDEPKPSNQEKDPSDWVTGGEPMTGAQASYLKDVVRGGQRAF